MVEVDFIEDEKKEDSQVLVEKTLDSSPKQKQLLKKQTEFELGEKTREAKEIEENKKRNRLEIIFRWGVLVLVAVGLFFMAKWLLF